MVQKRHITLIPFGVILLFLIAACDGGGDISTGAPTTPFIGGSQGLVIGFLAGSPPSEVTDGDTFPFNVIVKVKNVGEFDLDKKEVNVSLIGIAPSDFAVTANNIIGKIPEDDPVGRQRDSEGNIIEPVETFVEFPQEVIQADGSTDGNIEFNFKGDVTGNTIFVFRADICYNYLTDVLSDICILENQVDVADDSVCDPSESKTVFSSSSPVGVTSFRQSVVGKDKLQFSFDIIHSGSGTVFRDDASTLHPDCPKNPSTRRRSENKVNVTVDTGLTATAGNKLSCVGLTTMGTSGAGLSIASGALILVDGKRTVTCTQGLETPRSDFKKNVNINLTFDYLDSVDKEVLVKHLVS